MIVNRTGFKSIVSLLSAPGEYALDTETYGLARTDRLFSIAIADSHQAYYFNFLPYKGLDERCVLPRKWITELAPIVENEGSLFYLANAKYDMQKLALEGLYFKASVWDILSQERVLSNNLMGHKPYSLDACAERRGLRKDSSVDEYIKKHKLYTKVKIPGKDKLDEQKHFDKVPWELMSVYGENDAKITRCVGFSQKVAFENIDSQQSNATPISPLVHNEVYLTKVCFRMEETGIHIDRKYVTEAMQHEQSQASAARGEFTRMTGLEFSDSASVLKDAFTKTGISLPLTRTGQPCTNKAVLDALENPLADKIREIRKHEKLISTYYSSFLFYADQDDLIHPNMKTGGTETGRFSY